MPETWQLSTDQLRAALPQLRAGDRVLLSGTIYTARDAVIYYAGPTPGQQGMAVGACGPTTASRMNAFAPRLLDLGLAAIIGKGEMSDAVQEALVRNGACFFAAVGGAGALIAKCIETAQVIAFDDLGCESIKRMSVRDLPLTVALDSQGGNLYRTGRQAYAR